MMRGQKKRALYSGLRDALVRSLCVAIEVYRLLVSPWLGGRCRFWPTCSHYAQASLRLHGPWRGTLYALRRLSRCHPWGGFGYDPPPVPHDATNALFSPRPVIGKGCSHG